MQKLQIDEFLRSLKQNIDTPHSLLLGAGASIESGIQSATDCIWDWKKEIFISQNPGAIDNYGNSKLEIVRRVIQNWIDVQNTYPALNSDSEYSFYAETAYPIESDRRKYFQHIITNHNPSLGYHIISMLAMRNIIKCVWTTNFDGLMVKCAHQYSSLVPIEITAETSDRIYRDDVNQELLCVALHGDYKYGSLKNTDKELDSQDGELEKALLHQLRNRDLIVIGYSGRDKSIMTALERVYSEKGSGKLFWCGYGSNPADSVINLIEKASAYGRLAFYIPTDGFDSTFFSIARHCMSDDKSFLAGLDKIKNQLSSIVSTQTTNFAVSNKQNNKAVLTNAFPILFPNQCYQFEVDFGTNEKEWDYCKSLYKENIMAVPYKGIVYAWGNKEEIKRISNSKLKSGIELCPLEKTAVIQNGNLQELVLKTITFLLGNYARLGYSKDKIWDTHQIFKYRINGKQIVAYSGVRLSLLFDKTNCYLTLTPSYTYADSIRLSNEEKKQFADYFCQKTNNTMPNKNTFDYIKRWIFCTVGDKNIKLTFPLKTVSPFSFAIGCKCAMIGIKDSNRKSFGLPQNIPSKRLVFSGLEYKDPKLVFFNSSMNRKVEDFHPMRGLIKNGPLDSSIIPTVFGSSIKLGIICPQGFEEQFYSFIGGLNQSAEAKHNPDYLISFPGFFKSFKTGVEIPEISSANWATLVNHNWQNNPQSIKTFCNQITRKIDQISTGSDVILIYIPAQYECLTSYSDNYSKYDLHDYIKAYAAQKQIATQFIREKTVKSELRCQIMWALSLAIYVKSGKTPWNISGIQPDTAFAGIGYSVTQRNSGDNIVIGCSHIYTSDGVGMKYKLSKLQDVTIDRKKNPFMSENEAYKLGLNIKELFYKSFSDLPKRVVIHKRTPFRQEEIKGLVDSLSSAGIKDIGLIEISYEEHLKCFAMNQYHSNVDSFPVLRGMCFPISNNAMYLYTHGISPSVKSPGRRYIQGGKAVPIPLKIVQHYGSSNMAQIATEVLGLSRMNWNSFNLYSKLPCTIESSNQIARIGWLLSHYEGALYDYRYFM